LISYKIRKKICTLSMMGNVWNSQVEDAFRVFLRPQSSPYLSRRR
jgi:hypothetical protein